MDQRPNPDQLLKQIKAQEAASQKGRLKLFFGASPGVGKTYAMLEAARQRKNEGVDVVVGVVETHGRQETAALLQGLEILPRKKIDYKGVALTEFDLDGALVRKPALILMDELAHTNAPGSRHAKRWQDVQELLDAGIGVYTTLNVQHWESLNDVVAKITGVIVRETVPDTFLQQAHDVELVDISPEDLIRRLKDGKVYLGDQAERAAENFFQPGNLTALRELALRHTAERVDRQMEALKVNDAIWPVNERLLTAITPSPMSPRLVRTAARIAGRLKAPWIVVHVETPDFLKLPVSERNRLFQTYKLAEQLGAETATLSGTDVVQEILHYARVRNVTRIILGKPARPLWREWLFGSVVNRIARECGDIDLYIISGQPPSFSGRRTFEVSLEGVRWDGIAWGIGAVVLLTLLCWGLSHWLDTANLIMLYLIGVMAVAYLFGRLPALITAFLSVLAFDFFFVPPLYTFAISNSQYFLTFIVMFAAGLMISTVTGRLRQQTEMMRTRELRTRMLYRLSRALSETPDPEEMIKLAWSNLSEFYKIPVLLLMPIEQKGLHVVAGDATAFGLTAVGMGAAEWVFMHNEPAGTGTDTLAGVGGLFLPLKGLKRPIGVLALQPKDPAQFKDPDQMQLIETLASEVGGALESTQMSAEAGRAQAQIGIERTRNMVLSTFSFEVREPLHRMIEELKKLEETGGALSPAQRSDLIKSVQKSAVDLDELAAYIPELIEREVEEAKEKSG